MSTHHWTQPLYLVAIIGLIFSLAGNLFFIRQAKSAEEQAYNAQTQLKEIRYKRMLRKTFLQNRLTRLEERLLRLTQLNEYNGMVTINSRLIFPQTQTG